MTETHLMIPSFEELANELQESRLNIHASQVHGILCGYLCGSSSRLTEEKLWKKIFPKSKKNNAINLLLHQLYESTALQLSEFSFDFALLLPDDETDINLRAEALGLWCQGFLKGLTDMGVTTTNNASNEVAEVLEDFTEIAKISFGDMTTNEEDETAYIELLEYVRLSAVMIYQELRPQKFVNTENTMLH